MEKRKEIAIVNKKARFDYEILETWVAGIVLTGTEIKSIRLHKASLVDCYCAFHSGELYVQGMNIAEYDWGTYNNHAPKRERKLLLQKKELRKIERAVQDKGITIVGLKLFVNDKGLAKLLVGLGRGRKSFDKREYIKDKDNKRELDRVKKAYKK
ncbi:tmRNA-binding protein SmpB [Mucinivorans hirudinis]|uniref:SsrA-binding protein n=1 Tax=Mucinivorans hirudinis TaxID=1433126 RepID=A0A060R954_9BACT|nr:tmRNA-binding protein SmpB [Mucinivorans hirudinis]